MATSSIDKLKQVLDALNKCEEAEKQLNLCLAHVGDLAGVELHAAAIRSALYKNLVTLITLLLEENKEHSLSVCEPTSERDKTRLKMVCRLLVSDGAKEDSEGSGEDRRKRLREGDGKLDRSDRKRTRKTGDKGISTQFTNWACARAVTCGRQLTAFCDSWIEITTVLALTHLFSRFSIFDLGDMSNGTLTLLKNRRSKED